MFVDNSGIRGLPQFLAESRLPQFSAESPVSGGEPNVAASC